MVSAHLGFHDDRLLRVVGFQRLEAEVARRVHKTSNKLRTVTSPSLTAPIGTTS
jgi:hypothetical protein